MSDWKKENPIHGKQRGCVYNPIYDVAPMDMIIAVGFGDARVTKDNQTIYAEPSEETAFWTTQNAEDEALKDPEHDWRIVIYAPLYGRTFQRQGKEKWMLIDENMGFA